MPRSGVLVLLDIPLCGIPILFPKSLLIISVGNETQPFALRGNAAIYHEGSSLGICDTFEQETFEAGGVDVESDIGIRPADMPAGVRAQVGHAHAGSQPAFCFDLDVYTLYSYNALVDCGHYCQRIMQAATVISLPFPIEIHDVFGRITQEPVELRAFLRRFQKRISAETRLKRDVKTYKRQGDTR